MSLNKSPVPVYVLVIPITLVSTFTFFSARNVLLGVTLTQCSGCGETSSRKFRPRVEFLIQLHKQPLAQAKVCKGAVTGIKECDSEVSPLE